MAEALTGMDLVVEKAESLDEKLVEKIFAATQPGAVFGEPVVSGAYTVITASEIGAGGGFGFGSGTGPAQSTTKGGTAAKNGTAPEMAGGGGGGGGGGSAGRPVAAIVIGPDGVKVRPIVDATKIALAAVAAWGALGFALGRMARAKQR